MIHHLDSVFNISWRFRIWFLGSYCYIISVKVWDKYYFGGVSLCLKIRIRFRFQRIRATAVVIMGSIKQSNQRLRLDPSRSDLIHEYTDQRLSSRLESIADFLPWNYPINLFRERSMIVLSLNRASLFMEKARRFEIGGLVAIGLGALYFCGSVFLFQEVTSSNSFRYKLRAWIGVSLHHFPLVSLRYERLFGFCRRCHSLCHDQARCPTFGDKGKHRADPLPEDPKPEDKMQSYKGAVSQGLTSGSNSGASNSGEAGLGEAAGGQVAGNRRSAGPQVTNHHSKNGSGYKPKKGRKNPFQAPSHGSTSQLAISTTCINQLKTNMVGHGFSDHEQKMLDAFLGANSGNNAVEPGDSGPIGEGDSFNQEVLASTKTSRKNLFPNAEESMGNGKEGVSLGLMQQHDLFSDDLSQLIAQEFPLSDTIMEDQEIVPAVAFEEGEVQVAADRSLEEEGEEESDIMGTDQAEVTEEITEDHVTEEGNKESPQEGEGVDTEQPVRKKVVRNKAFLTGVSSRKINLHNVVSPRKRTGNKPAGLPVVKGPHQGEKAPPKH